MLRFLQFICSFRANVFDVSRICQPGNSTEMRLVLSECVESHFIFTGKNISLLLSHLRLQPTARACNKFYPLVVDDCEMWEITNLEGEKVHRVSFNNSSKLSQRTKTPSVHTETHTGAYSLPDKHTLFSEAFLLPVSCQCGRCLCGTTSLWQSGFIFSVLQTGSCPELLLHSLRKWPCAAWNWIHPVHLLAAVFFTAATLQASSLLHDP